MIFYEHLIPGLTDMTVYLYHYGFVAGYGTAIDCIVRNNGSLSVTANLQLNIDPTFTVDSMNLTATVTGNTYSFPVTALQPDSIKLVRIYATIPASALGNQLNITANLPVAGDAHPADNTDTLTNTVVGSYDPNEKTVNRPLHFNGSRELVYTVQFQNTGTYPAKNVIVTDTIDSHLDLSTFKLLTASPSMPVITWHDGNVLYFSFPNIYLPDSNSNQAASHGSFTYSLQAASTVQVGDSICNTAYIYFDYNAPVVTSTTLNIFSSAPAGIRTVAMQVPLSLYPNPTTGLLNIDYQFPTGATGQLTISDVYGRVIKRQQLSPATRQATLHLDGAAAGLYYYQLQINGQQAASGKLTLIR